MSENIKKILKDHEDRLRKIENMLISDKGKKDVRKKSYKGLAGGIRLLIDNGFLNQPKTSADILLELKSEGYYNSESGVRSTLFTTFIKSQRVLSRIQEKKVWKYVLRK